MLENRPKQLVLNGTLEIVKKLKVFGHFILREIYVQVATLR